MQSNSQFEQLARVIANPSHHYHPALAVAVWCKAKGLCGQPVTDDRLHRIGVDRSTIDPALMEQIAREERVRLRTREHAARRGGVRPAPLILPDAIA
ncbi:hypothetical protein [Ruegeria sp. HKCCD8929]|uniref:hypothetical protein n=1 Tax=Ruegeria sp. HKCCD8929 TaxID=2683006 RepID=UPI00148873BE|nr:hypothetical protein [Ruegeria sp. HKCCD8929]